MSDDDPWLRFADLKRMKIVNNHVTLKRWIEREGFPRGCMLGPNTRAWRESEVEAWLVLAQPTTRSYAALRSAASWQGAPHDPRTESTMRSEARGPDR